LKFETEGTGGQALLSDWFVGVVKGPHSFFHWFVSVIVVAAAAILPTYFRARGGAVPWCACAAPGAPPGSSRTCEGAGRRGACFGSVSFEAEARNEVAINSLDLERRYNELIAVPSSWTLHPGSLPGVTCIPPTVLEPVSRSLYPGLAVPVVLRALQ
jgi:hypothetical protein